MICNQCGTSSSDQARFCGGCGAPFGYIETDPQTRLGYSQPNAGDPARVGYDHVPSADNRPAYPPGYLYQSADQSPMSVPASPLYQPVASTGQATGKLSKSGKIMGIIVGCLCLLGLIPCLGWLNWFTLIVGVTAKVICWVAVFTEGREDLVARNNAVIGLVIATIAVFVGLVRLIVGGGCI